MAGRVFYLSDEAKEDGVTLDEDGWFLIPCEICGRKVIHRTQYSRKRQYICSQCKENIKNLSRTEMTMTELQNEMAPYEKRFSTALDELEKQVGDLEPYQKAIKTAHTRVEKYGSVPEVLAAIELLKNKYQIIPQQPVGKYKVDFCIPSIKVVLEIDGLLYHQNSEKEGLRDLRIQYALGSNWTIIHYPAECISNNVTLLVPHIEMRLRNEAKAFPR